MLDCEKKGMDKVVLPNIIWMSGIMLKDQIRNDCIRSTLKMVGDEARPHNVYPSNHSQSMNHSKESKTRTCTQKGHIRFSF